MPTSPNACHKITELFELLVPEWNKNAHLNLLEFLQILADEAGHEGDLQSLSDDILIYHLKMRNQDKDTMIPGMAKDCVEDFKSALLKARGIND